MDSKTKTDVLGCPSQRGVCLIESQVSVKLFKSSRDGTNTRCPSNKSNIQRCQLTLSRAPMFNDRVLYEDSDF